MADSRATTEQKILTLINGQSDDPNVDPATARQEFAKDMAKIVHDAIVGRQTVVTGTSASGGPVTGTGIIQEA
ncbi:hypothetical protein [Flavobacterium cerinum]|uniref:Uncharacterized protein n=1 Tax=Flavobacterium cerinum TaxID=2502784 RepID=A0A3S3RL78_9FLAO|nr:hypothetical protein [Flavobacterium cerinum]RWX03358.1 hypothetical protein EPI11_00065 [Flavobacterium cerinum]